MEGAALIHRPESEMAYLVDNHYLKITLMTKHQDVAQVRLHYGDPYQEHWQVAAMMYDGTGQTHDYWTATITVPYQRARYLFEVVGTDHTRVLLGDRGLRTAVDRELKLPENYFRLPFFHPIDRVAPPAWVKQTVWYQIFPDRFANGDETNDPSNTLPWRPEAHPSRTDVYGGDLQGVIDHLDDLAELGINGLYLTPIFTAPSNHKYDTLDYYQVDPAFGDKRLLSRLVAAAHQRGMKVMLDAVFNHLGSESIQWQDVVANGSQSRYRDWFHIDAFPVTPYHDPTSDASQPQYATFGFEPHMPKLNTANPEVQDYLIAIATYWIKNFDIDAWRLDVANEVDHHFWRRFQRACREAKPEIYLLGEVWHTSQAWLQGDQFDGVMNYAAMQQVNEYWLNRRISAAEMVARLIDQSHRYRDQTNQVMLNLLDSHDTPRLMTMAAGNWALAYQTLAFMFMQVGTPCLYYGTEMAMTGDADPDNRKPMDWRQLHQPVWQQVQALVQWRRHFNQQTPSASVQLKQSGPLLRVIRLTASGPVTGWFNLSDSAQPLAVPESDCALSQGFAHQQLAPFGFVIKTVG